MTPTPKPIPSPFKADIPPQAAILTLARPQNAQDGLWLAGLALVSTLAGIVFMVLACWMA